MSAVLINFPATSRPLPKPCRGFSEVRGDTPAPVLRAEEMVVWAMEQLEKDLRRHVKDNPSEWHFSEWKLSFITDSKRAAPPIVKLMKTGPH